jgi:hypothetical protein
MFHDRACRPAVIAALLLVPVFAAGPSFLPDTTFKGSSLAGWRTLGQAEWRAQNGEIVGTAKPGGAGGWLMLGKSFQDVGFFASFQCAAGCRTGVLFRAEKTAEGMKGVYVSLSEENVTAYKVTLGADGQELQREPLRFGGGTVRIAPPQDPNAAGRNNPRAGGGRSSVTSPSNLPITAPKRGLRPGEWNEIEMIFDANIIRWFVNGLGDIAGAVAEEDAARYGPLALYIGGAGEVRFKDVGYRDLAIRVAPPEQVASRFRLQRLNEFYYAWSASADDFNKDGVLDVVAGPYIYFGPDYTKSREIFPAIASSPSKEYASNCMIQFSGDVTGDGWPDVVCSNLGTPVFLYVNPKGESRRWDKFQVAPSIQCEIMEYKDIDGDGKPELVYAAEGYLRYAKPDPANPTGPWIVHTISERGVTTLHGIGTGDINGDGRKDIVNVYGWWEHPPAGSQQEPWTYHPVAFGRWSRSGPGGALMAVYDVNGDKLNDVVTSLGGHDFGLAWYEQKRDAGGKISFTPHIVMGDYATAAKNAGGVTFSQLHGSTFGDVDGDGVPDFIVGKRYWSHLDNYHDPDPYSPPVLYWYRTVRDPKAPGGASFVPELIHNRSGAGSTLMTVDLNKDGAKDIIAATDRGAFIFWGKPRAAAKAAVTPSK